MKNYFKKFCFLCFIIMLLNDGICLNISNPISILSPKSNISVLSTPLANKFYDLLVEDGKISIMTICHYNMERSVLSYHLIDAAIIKNGLNEYVTVNSATPFLVPAKSKHETIYYNERKQKPVTFKAEVIKASKAIIIDMLQNAGIFFIKQYQKQMTKHEIRAANILIIFDENPLKHQKILEDVKYRVKKVTRNPKNHIKKFVQIKELIPDFDVWDFASYQYNIETILIPAIKEAINRYQLNILKSNRNVSPHNSSS